jgi:hypothetical protein
MMTSIWFWLFLLTVLIALFAGPTVIALIRGIDDVGFILLLTGIAVVTLVVLPVAYVMAIILPGRIRDLDRPPPPG